MNDSASISAEIRPLVVGDLYQVANIHVAAFPESALTKMGDATVYRYYKWQLSGPHQAIAIGCFYHSQLAGYCFAGIYNGAMSGFLNKNKTYLAWRIFTHPWLLLNEIVRTRVRFGMKIIQKSATPVGLQCDYPHVKPRSFGVLAIAVHPRYQGVGLGRLIMDFTEAYAFQKGFQKLNLSVDKNNTNAIKFYEKMGWCKVLDDNIWNGVMEKIPR